MTRFVYRSKKVLIGAAFMGAMVGTGGFLGAMAGVILALLARSVLAINTGTGEFIAAWGLAGCLAALLLGVYMTVREFGYLVKRTKVVPVGTAAPATEGN